MHQEVSSVGKMLADALHSSPLQWIILVMPLTAAV